MKHLNKTLIAFSTSLLIAGTASALEPVADKANNQAQPIVKISKEAVKDARAAFNQPLLLDASALTVPPSENEVTADDVVYSDDLDINYEVTDTAFIGIADVNNTRTIHTPKGGFPEGRIIEPYNSVLGGGVKTTF